MGYQDEWNLLEAEDEIDEMEHRQPTEEFLFYQAVSSGDVEAVKNNCEMGRFLDSDDYLFMQTKRDGAGAGVPDERLLYSASGRCAHGTGDQESA